MSHDVIGTIAGNGYLASNGQLKQLGALSVGAEKLKFTIGTTYIRALVCHSVDIYKGGTMPTAAVAQAHKGMYPEILAGVVTDDVAPLPNPLRSAGIASENKRRSLERNSRSNFARTAASTLRRFTEAGGDLTTLDISTLTKGSIAAATPTPTESDGGVTVSYVGIGRRATYGGAGATIAFARFLRELDRWQTADALAASEKQAFINNARKDLAEREGAI